VSLLDADDTIGMMCVSHGMLTKTFDVEARNSSMLSGPPNILSVILLGAGLVGVYLLLFACLRMSAMFI
jgi:hypothetical protein